MKSIYPLLVIGLLLGTPAAALGKKEISNIVEQAYPGAEVTEIDLETYQGKKIYEVDFNHDGRKLEAVISLDGEIIKVDVDD